MIKKTLVVVGCMLALGAGVAQAEGLYGGLSAGFSSVDIDKQTFDDTLTGLGVTGFSSKVDEQDIGYKAFLGYRFNPYFALEGGYVNLGSPEYTASYTGGKAKFDWHSHGMFLQALGSMPIGSSVTLFIKGGAYFSENEVDLSASGPLTVTTSNLDDDEVNFVFGLGGEYAFNDTFGMRLEWERYMDVGDPNLTGESDVDLVTLGVTFNF